MRSLMPIAVCVLLGTASPAGAQPTPPVRTGVRGRLVVSPALRDAKVWPVDEDRLKSLRSSSWIRRPTGRSTVAPMTEPNPPLDVVVGGVAEVSAAARKMVFENGHFTPAQLVTTVARPLEVENRGATKLSVRVGEASLDIPPGTTQSIPRVAPGVHVLKVNELSNVSATIRVLDRATILPVNDDGIVPDFAIEAGDYELAFYHGAHLVLSRELKIKSNEKVAIDANISDNVVVSVSLKDGGLQIVGPSRPLRTPPRPRPRPPKPPPPTPEPAPPQPEDSAP